jgi:RimJ/RimL family protein N-acetyltransferase
MTEKHWPGLLTRLEGERVVLEPVTAEHEDGLRAAVTDERVWRWIYPDLSFDDWFAATLHVAETGKEAPFATVDARNGEVLGSSRYLSLREVHGGLEIGWTFLTPSAWGTGANVEAKLLMLAHAFDDLGCMRVEFKTNALNERSRGALAALPAQFEGVFRKHMRIPGLGVRDSAYYAVVDDDWPAVRANLERRLSAHAAA